MSDERGQALLIAAALLAVAAIVVSGLRLSQDAILSRERASRAGEAAVEAAAAVVADAYVAELRRAAFAEPPERPRVTDAIAAPDVRERARAAASDLSTRNGGPEIFDVLPSCGPRGVDVTLVIETRSYRAGFRADECSLP